MSNHADQLPDFASLWVDLAQPRLCAAAIHATDDFFAPKERMIDPAPPVFIPGKYDDNGKWMDGWESRRRRGPGHDHCTIRLGRPGRAAALARFLDYARRHPAVWFCRRIDIARHWRAEHPATV